MEEQHLKEWETARQTIQEFDERLHDLRKYGFSFLTGLLTAEAVLIPGPVAAAFKEPGVPLVVLLAVLVVTFILIFALRLLDRSYVLFISAIAQRAMVLERVLNLELTEVIAQRHNDQKIGWYVRLLYFFLTVAVGVMGAALFWSDQGLSWGIFLLSFVVAFFIDLVGSLKPTHGPRGEVDWIVGRTECAKGDSVSITVTNLQEKEDPNNPFFLEPGVYGEVRSQDGVLAMELKVDTRVRFPPEGNYTWIWKTDAVPEGLYLVFPYAIGERPGPWTPVPVPLRRTIAVGKKREEKAAQAK